jgi:Ni,Fe-hydrogenase I cytochrome b subunit
MYKSKYLEKITEESNNIRSATAKKTLTSIIMLIVVSIAFYIGLPLLDPRAVSTGTMLSAIFGILSLIFIVKFIFLSGSLSNKVLAKCQQEIQNNLHTDESFETFDADITNPAFGEHNINGMKVLVGKTFVLFERFTAKGPHLQIVRGDILGDYDVHYLTQNGVGTDIGVDIKNKNGKLIRSVMTSDKKEFYEFLNAMEKIKSYVNGNDTVVEESSFTDDHPFVEEVKNGVARQDKKGYTKIGVFGLVFGIFLFIAGSSSGVAFIYGGLVLFIISLIFIILVNVLPKR